MDSVEVLLSKALDEVNDEANEILFKCMSKAMRKAKKEVIMRSPVLTAKYKKGWTTRTLRLKTGFDGVIYNKTYPGLTHLLNNGHIKANQYGTYGRENGDNHITKARNLADEYLIQLLNEAQL